MTRVAGWVQAMTEEVLGGSPVAIASYYQHPEDGLIKITSGQYWGEHGLSNFWYWQVISTGEIKHGYAGRWPQVEDPWKENGRCEDRTRSPRGAYRCVLSAGHEADPLSLHEINIDAGVEDEADRQI